MASDRAELQPLQPPSKKDAFQFGCLKSVGRFDLCIQGQRPHRSTRLKLWRTASASSVSEGSRAPDSSTLFSDKHSSMR